MSREAAVFVEGAGGRSRIYCCFGEIIFCCLRGGSTDFNDLFFSEDGYTVCWWTI